MRIGGTISAFVLNAMCWYFAVEEESFNRIKAAHRWRAPDGWGIKHSEALNPTIGFLANKLYVDVDSMMLHSLPVSVSVPGGLYLYALKDRSDVFFDSVLLGMDGKELEKDIVCLRKLLDAVQEALGGEEEGETASYANFLAKLVAVGMGRKVDQKDWGFFDDTIEKYALSKKEEHKKEVKSLVEYLSQPEEPYIVGGKVDINRFLGSKTFLMQVVINGYVYKTERFYNALYEEVKDIPDIVEKYYLRDPADTKYERLMKKRAMRFLMKGKGNVLARPDLRLITEGYVDDGSRDTVGFVYSSKCAILSLLCVAFYDPGNKKYTVEHLPSSKKELKEFFTRHPEPFEYAGVESDWCKVLDSLSDSEIQRKSGGGEDGIVPTIKNVCRVVCSLCGIETAGKSTAEIVAEVSDKLVFSKYGDSSGVFSVMDRIVPSAKIQKGLSEVNSIGIRSLVSTDGGYVGARIECFGGMEFEVVECMRFGKDEIDAGNIVDYLAKTYLRHYHSEQRMRLGMHRYCWLHLYGKETRDKYVALCLDKIFEKARSDEGLVGHPRLQEVRDLAMAHKSRLIQEVFAAAMEGSGYEITREVVENVGVNLLDYLVRHERNKGLPDEVLEEVIAVAVSNNRRDMVEYISRSANKDVMEQGFVRGFCLLVRDIVLMHTNAPLTRMPLGVNHMLYARRYNALLRDYCPAKVQIQELEGKAVRYCYEYFFEKQADFPENNHPLDFLVRMTLDESTQQLLYEHLAEFIQKDKGLLVYWKGSVQDKGKGPVDATELV
jgi:hypothetical protein